MYMYLSELPEPIMGYEGYIGIHACQHIYANMYVYMYMYIYLNIMYICIHMYMYL
jgi:hypothetical protein